MAKEKSLVEEAIIQMKNLEEAVAENAKGILASTMKEEIKELVKESLTEQEDEVEVDAEMEEPEMEEPMDMGDDEEGMEMDADNIDDMGDEEDTIDLTDVDDDDEILRVFSLMGPEDNIVVTKDDAGNINLKDSEKEYMIVGEGEEDEFEFDIDELGEEWNESDEMEFDMNEEDENIDDIVSKVFDNDDEEESEEDEKEDMKKSLAYSEELIKSYIDDRFSYLDERLTKMASVIESLANAPIARKGVPANVQPLHKSTEETNTLSKSNVIDRLFELKKSGTYVDSSDMFKLETSKNYNEVLEIANKYGVK